MKEVFKPKKFSPEAQDLINQAVVIIDRYRASGYKLSLRQLYYQLVSVNAVPNTEQSYDRVGTIISDARMAGLCDWDMIEDRNRETVIPSHWDNPGQLIDACARAYKIDKWGTQPFYCEVMVEKQALEGVLEPVCKELDIPFTANKGYSSITMMYQTGKRLANEFKMRCQSSGLIPNDYEDYPRNIQFSHYLLEQGIHDGQGLTEYGRKLGYPRIVVFYMGDHDPSGMDMTRDVLDRINTFSDYTPIEVKRLALNMKQIDELQPPENPAKMTDSRAKKYVDEFGYSSWELDAVRPESMAQMVRDAVLELRDDHEWNRAVTRENNEKEQLRKLAVYWKDPDAMNAKKSEPVVTTLTKTTKKKKKGKK